MPSYVREGSVPHKRHIQFRRPDGGLYAEELFSTKGFESVYSLLYHLRPPTATLDVRPWKRPTVHFSANEPLRNRHLKTQTLARPGAAASSTSWWTSSRTRTAGRKNWFACLPEGTRTFALSATRTNRSMAGEARAPAI